jgi:hypothetical protein
MVSRERRRHRNRQVPALMFRGKGLASAPWCTGRRQAPGEDWMIGEVTALGCIHVVAHEVGARALQADTPHVCKQAHDGLCRPEEGFPSANESPASNSCYWLAEEVLRCVRRTVLQWSRTGGGLTRLHTRPRAIGPIVRCW